MESPTIRYVPPPEPTQLSPRQIVWIEVYKAHVAAGNSYPLSYVQIALTHFEQTFCEAK